MLKYFFSSPFENSELFQAHTFLSVEFSWIQSRFPPNHLEILRVCGLHVSGNEKLNH